MPPSVRIESKAWDDPAFAILANRLGMPDPDLALIKCGRVWAYCTEHNDPKVSVELVDAITRTPSFASAMVFAKLASFCDENAAVLVAGATGKNRNRIAWLATKRKNSRKGGAAKQAKSKPIGKPNRSRDEAERLPSYSGSGSAPVPSPAPAPASGSERDLVAAGDQPALLSMPERAFTCDLLAIYKRHPRHEGKAKGLAKLKAQIKSPADYADLERAHAAYLRSDPVRNGFVRHFDTWVNSWRDHLEPEHRPPERPYNGRG